MRAIANQSGDEKPSVTWMTNNVKIIAALVVGFLVVNGSFYTISPTERGNVRRFGVPLLDKTDKPL
ncbi:MAG: hypothetical protein WCK65_12490 [Rhodospirillaceae bacterium]